MRYWWCVVVLAAVAACGGGSGDPVSIGEVAAKVGCHGFTSDSSELFVAASGSCDGVRGIDQVATFNNNDARDSWLKFAHAFGGVCTAGDQWVVCGQDRSAVERIQQRLGGEIRD